MKIKYSIKVMRLFRKKKKKSNPFLKLSSLTVRQAKKDKTISCPLSW